MSMKNRETRLHHSHSNIVRYRVAALSDIEYKNDVLICAGDVSDDLEVLRKALSSLASKWRHVFFVPGNHELWIRKGSGNVTDSLSKTSQS